VTATIHPPERVGAIEVLRGLVACKKPSIRSFREWIEAEFRIPDGPFKGRLFRVRRQPYAGLWIDAVDSDQYNRFASVGPTQSGKTLLCSVAICMFYLFECGENVGFGLPDMRMAGDKWRQDLLPAIKASRYAALLPTKGKGSRGGNVEEIHFKNGVVLKFVSGGSRGARGDKGRAGFTCRIMILTEVDGYDTASGTSREADPVTQLEARTRAYDSRKRFFMECTASIPTGRIWREYTTGTQSVIVGQCPHCAEWVAPGPGDLQGWEDAKHEIEARENGHFICPECDEVLT
jgi:phage terminase large subunit GpA-like protein